MLRHADFDLLFDGSSVGVYYEPLPFSSTIATRSIESGLLFLLILHFSLTS
jgi:hypothetical protein